MVSDYLMQFQIQRNLHVVFNLWQAKSDCQTAMSTSLAKYSIFVLELQVSVNHQQLCTCKLYSMRKRNTTSSLLCWMAKCSGNFVCALNISYRRGAVSWAKSSVSRSACILYSVHIILVICNGIDTQTYMDMCIYTCLYMNTYTHTCTHTYIDTYKYIHKAITEHPNEHTHANMHM